MPRAIIISISVLALAYSAGTLALCGMMPYTELDSIGGFPSAFRDRNMPLLAEIASAGEVLTLPVVVLVAFMAQPRLQYALAEDGLLPPWFGKVDGGGNLRNGTAFGGLLMTLVASFVPFRYVDDTISAGCLVAFSMTCNSLILLRTESPDDRPGLLERILTVYNALCLAGGLLLSSCFCATLPGRLATAAVLLAAAYACYLIGRRCPPAAYFGGKTRVTTQHIQLGIVSLDNDEGQFRTPFLPYLPCLGIFVNWYLVTQLSAYALLTLMAFLTAVVAFYFAYGFRHSVGNNGGWEEEEALLYKSFELEKRGELDLIPGKDEIGDPGDGVR